MYREPGRKTTGSVDVIKLKSLRDLHVGRDRRDSVARGKRFDTT